MFHLFEGAIMRPSDGVLKNSSCLVYYFYELTLYFIILLKTSSFTTDIISTPESP
jgi:hypothetical protein